MPIFVPRCRAILRVVFDGFGGPDSEPTRVPLVPDHATVHGNTPKDPDEFTIEFAEAILPLPADLITAAAVEIYVYRLPEGVNDSDGFLKPQYRRIAGLVDPWDTVYSDDGTVTLQGRDYTALMTDRPWDPTQLVPVGQPLDEVVQGIVDICAQKKLTGRSLFVRWMADGDPPVVAARGTRKRGIPSEEGESCWDVIYRVCLEHGVIATVRDDAVLITTPQALTVNRNRFARVARPGRSVLTQRAQPAQPPVRKLAVGRNLERLKIGRKLTLQSVPQIVVHSYDPQTGNVIEGRFPSDAHQTKHGKNDKPKSYIFPGLHDPLQAERIAETVYNALARSESESKFTTIHLQDLDGLELLDMRQGDPVLLTVDRPGAQDLQRMTMAQRVRYLTDLGQPLAVAQVIATNLERLQRYVQPRYLKTFDIDWENADGGGISLEGTAENFVMVERDDASR